MNAAQLNMYRAIWGQVRKKLRSQGMPPAEADAMRHQIIRDALGADKSSYDFTNEDLDKVKAAMVALLEPSLLGPQMEDQDRKRHLWKLDRLLEAQQKPRGYAEAIARRMAGEKKISSDDLETMPLPELRKIIGALMYQGGGAKRVSKKKQALAKLAEAAPADPDWSVN